MADDEVRASHPRRPSLDLFPPSSPGRPHHHAFPRATPIPGPRGDYHRREVVSFWLKRVLLVSAASALAFTLGFLSSRSGFFATPSGEVQQMTRTTASDALHASSLVSNKGRGDATSGSSPEAMERGEGGDEDDSDMMLGKRKGHNV
jgi:hypothetical protein